MVSRERSILAIDGGTTNTRLTILTGGQPSGRVVVPSGAAQGREALMAALVEAFGEFAPGSFEVVYASGMITSPTGLADIPHIAAPAGLVHLAGAVETRMLPQICDKPFYFVPGIKFGSNSADVWVRDALRGEETEIMGYADELNGSDALFLHFGSHHKAILYSSGAITDCVTTMSGELLSAVCRETILKSSTQGWQNVAMDPQYIALGYKVCREQRLPRTLFTARLLDIQFQAGSDAVVSYILGALACEDLQAFEPLIGRAPRKIVLYGRDSAATAFAQCLGINNPTAANRITILSHAQSEALSLRGLWRIAEASDLLDIPPFSH